MDGYQPGKIMNRESVTTLLKYEAWADAETLTAIKKIDAEAWPEKQRLALRLMNHIFVVDTIFKANLIGEAHGYTALNTPETPSADRLLSDMAACTAWYGEYVSALAEASLRESVTFRFVDGGEGKMVRGDMLHHLLFHGTYHRGAVGWLLSEAGVKPPQDVLTVFLRDHYQASV